MISNEISTQNTEAFFLTPSIKEIRKSIRDIDDSYNNDWDILAELCQNSVDAIKKSKPQKPRIYIEINCPAKSIIVEDNGSGIDPDQLAILLAPFSTNKENDENTIGEKGVGLTFVLFSCNNFKIVSGNEKGSKIGSVKDAYNWKTSSQNENIKILLSNPANDIKGTIVELRDIHDIPLFKLSFDQIKFILRTRTAIGNTNKLWNSEEENIEVILKHKDLDNEEKEEVIKNMYWTPFEHLSSNSKIDLDEFITYANDADRTDQDKRRKLQDKVIYKRDNIWHAGRKLSYITCFVPKRKVWETESIKLNLCKEEELSSNQWLDEFGYCMFQSGIFTSVKGMPTGISIEHPTTGYAGYWSNIFILFEDKHLKFDIGRKSIHGMTARIYKNYAHTIFNEYLKYVSKYVSGEVTNNSEWDKEEIFAEINNLIDLNNTKTKFIKIPKDQEASVAGIFFECIGNGIINDIRPLVSGYRNKYDLYARWGNKNIVIEFKSKLKNILKDFNDEQKLFDEIDCVVCWSVTEDDVQHMKNKGITLEKINSSSLSSNQKKQVPNSTHELILSGFTKPIYVIDMKDVLK